MMHRWRLVLRLVGPLALLGALGCPKPAAPVAASAPSGLAHDDDSATSAALASPPSTDSSGIRSVYPPLEGAPHPLAERLCRALHDEPEARRKACCGRARASLSGAECRRMLTASLASGALVVDEAKIGACEAAVRSSTEGCGWVKPRAGLAPAACLDLAAGVRKHGEACRSSLECEGALTCRALSSTSEGVCKPAAGAGSACGGGVDPLAVYLRQHDSERRHPPCQGFCGRGRCQQAQAIAGPCRSNIHCGPGAFCDGEVCRAGEPALGGACADSGCAAGTLCIGRRCVALKKEGEPCTSELECEGGCVKETGTAEGKCGMQCFARVGG